MKIYLIDPLKNSGQKYEEESFEEQIQEVFKIRGWNTEGFPTNETLERLGLSKL
jgi:aldehyde:ferredoxin oxidoreductase